MALTPTPTDRNKREYLESKLNREFQKEFYTDDEGYLVEREKHAAPVLSVVAAPRRTVQRKQRGASARSSAKSGDGNSDDPDSDPERRQTSLRLFDQASLADLLCISKKTLQNQYSVAPHTLPAAIQIPGARGPRWTPQAVQAWLSERPLHTSKPAPKANKKNKVGRPRIALAVAGGAA